MNPKNTSKSAERTHQPDSSGGRSSEHGLFSRGAKLLKCALQVNPFEYVKRHRHSSKYSSEDEYNEDMVEKCHELGIQVIAVTDHHRVETSKGLIQAARDNGIHAFSGFEAYTKDGLHFLCLFGKEKENDLDRFLGSFGITEQSGIPVSGKLDAIQLMEEIKNCGAVCIAAHITSDNGLLKHLEGHPRINAWKSDNLLACAIPGPVGDVPESYTRILNNTDPQYKRERMPAILNASDVDCPEDLAKPQSSSYIKMSEMSIEGLRQAFLDPQSRVRLHSDKKPEPHGELLSLSWNGGFLRDTSITFNENLNVLIGGRGTGKSTVVESIRFALGLTPIGMEAGRCHEGVVKHVLKAGTKVSLHVRTYKPNEQDYIIERTVSNSPVVRNSSGEELALSPVDVFPGIEVYGQHEILELSRDKAKLTRLLDRFVERKYRKSEKKQVVLQELVRARDHIVNTCQEIRSIDERLATLPALEETQKRFQELGVEDLLKEQTLLVKEERLLREFEDRVDQFETQRDELSESLPIDKAFVSKSVLENLANGGILAGLGTILGDLSNQLAKSEEQMKTALDRARGEYSTVKESWLESKNKARDTYESLLRKLQKDDIDGEEFIQLRKKIESLQPLRSGRANLSSDLEIHRQRRKSLLEEYDQLKEAEYKGLKKAAMKVSASLENRVQVDVSKSGNIVPLIDLLRDNIDGNLSSALHVLKSEGFELSLTGFAQDCRQGKEHLMEKLGIAEGAAEKLANAGDEVFMKMEEMDLLATTEIRLNTALVGQKPQMRKLEDLSSGQKAAAILLLLLLESDAPLVVDQPEDDLDNRFITDSVVPTMRKQKQLRQFVFSTHNANIPVLGDAEMILGLDAEGEGGAAKAQARIAECHRGSIDLGSVRELVEETLEGGKLAFETRLVKYGF